MAQQKDSPDIAVLRAADVQAWLRGEGYLHSGKRSRTTTSVAKPRKIVDGEMDFQWCCVCGLRSGLHALALRKRGQGKETKVHGKSESMIVDADCPIATQDSTIFKLQPIDVGRMLTVESLNTTKKLGSNPTLFDCKHIIRLVDPKLTLAIRRLIEPLCLSSFDSGSGRDSPFPLDHVGQTPAEIENKLAPYSMLAMLLGPFIRRIVLPGLDVAKTQKKAVTGSLSSRAASKKVVSDNGLDVSLLTPTHILTGIRNRGRDSVPGNDGVGEAILLCLSSLGTPFSCRLSDVPKKQATVKAEQL